MKKIIAMLLAALMVMSVLVGCGGGGDEDNPNLGTYKLQSLAGMSVEELKDLIGEDMSESFIFEMKSGGKGVFTVDGEAGDVKWEMDGDTITISDGSDEMTGTIADGTLTIEIEGEELVMVKSE